MKPRQVAAVAVGFGLGTAALVLYVGSVGVGEILADAGDVVWPAVGLAAGMIVVGLLIDVLVLDRLMGPGPPEVGVREIGPLFFSAHFAKSIAPMGSIAGAPYLAYILQRVRAVRFERGLAGVVASDLVGLVPLLTFGVGGLVSIATAGRLTPFLGGLVVGAVAAVIAFGALLSLIVYKRGTAELALIAVIRPFQGLVARRKPAWSERLSDEVVGARVGRFYEAFDRIVDPPSRLVGALLLAFVAVALSILPLTVLGEAMGAPIPIEIGIVIVPVSALASVVPTPGGIGPVEVTMSELLFALGGLDRPTAIAVTLLYRLVAFWIPLAIGALATASLAGPSSEAGSSAGS